MIACRPPNTFHMIAAKLQGRVDESLRGPLLNGCSAVITNARSHVALTTLAVLLLTCRAGLSQRANNGGAPVAGPWTANEGRAVLVLHDQMPGIDPTHVRMLVDRLQEAGLPAGTISCAELADGAVLSPDRVDTLVLTNSSHFPAVAFGNLMTFLHGGGNIVLMGGRPFRQPIFRSGDAWRTPTEFAETLAGATRRTASLFSFDDGNVAQWQRGASNREAPTRIGTDIGHVGQALRLDLRDVTWYDVVGAVVNSEIPDAHNSLCLWAKADPGTPQLFVEMTERDGSRWSRAVDVTAEWRFYVLPATTFLFKAPGANAERGGKTDQLSVTRGAKVAVGLAKDRTPVVGSAHTLWIDEIGTLEAPSGLGAAQTGLSFRDAFDDYAVYRLDDTTSLRTHAAQDWLKTEFHLDGRVSGLSAVGFSSPHESTFVPLLAAEDTHGRVVGWAAGMLIHHAGLYAGSQWGLFGVEDPSFYTHVQTLDFIVELLRGFASEKWLDRARQEHAEASIDRLTLQCPAPPPLTIRDGHFVYPDGRRFFMIGVNYWNSFDTFYGGGVQWDVRRLERDFARMERAGINAIRIHGFNRFALPREPHRLDTFLELCRRHRIYVLAGIGLGDHSYLRDGKTAMQTEARRLAALLKDEPVILGYDLQNEPYWWKLAKAPVDNTTLGKRFPIPKGAWDEYFRSINVCEGNWTSTFPGLAGALPIPEDARLRRAYDAANAIMGAWIGWLVEAIRTEDITHPITVGYNTILDCLPANRPLDFVSHHVYETPEDLAHVTYNLTTLDRLRHIWPDRPITLGEFGYSSGDIIGAELLDIHTQAVGEIIHWLYALANDYDGAMKWQLCDANAAYQWRFATWRRTDPAVQRLRQRRFGMFWPDGTLEGRPKPIVHATRFLRECIDAGLMGGKLELSCAPNLIGTGYVFRGERVLFVGGSNCESTELSVTSPRPVNVMLRWDDHALTILATADATVVLRASHFLPGKHVTIGGPDRSVTLEDVGEGRIRIRLFEGRRVTLLARGNE